MKKGAGYIVVGLLVYLASLVFTAPAELCYRLFKNRVRLPVPVELYGIEGSWRNGRAAQLVVNGRQYADFVWRVDVLPLLIGKKSGRIGFQPERGAFSGNIEAGQDTITMTKVQARIPAQVLEGYMPDFGIKLNGDLNAAFDSLRFAKGSLVAAGGAVVWRGAEAHAPERLALGDIKAQFGTEPGGVRVTLSDGGGPLLVAGQILFKPDRTYSFTGSFAARDRTQPMLADTLQIFGKPGSDGRISVAYSGRLPMLAP